MLRNDNLIAAGLFKVQQLVSITMPIKPDPVEAQATGHPAIEIDYLPILPFQYQLP